MSRPKAASRAAAANVAASLATLLSPARAEASRRNGAKSKGPKTAEGKTRSSRNALKHGLCAEHHVVVEGESAEAFAAFEAALAADLAPEGALQALLAGRIARAAWRLERAERIEAELFARQMDNPFGEGGLGLALIRDGNGARAFDTLLRYRGAAQAELARALRLLKALQAEAAQEAAPPRRIRAQLAPAAVPPAPCERPIELESRRSPRQPVPAGPADGPRTTAEAGADTVRRAEHIGPRPCPPARPLPENAPENPNEPETRRNPGGTASASGPGGGEALAGEAEARHPGE